MHFRARDLAASAGPSDGRAVNQLEATAVRDGLFGARRAGQVNITMKGPISLPGQFGKKSRGDLRGKVFEDSHCAWHISVCQLHNR